jgi:phosphatidylinositol alpha-1,6-mannosyltransferase
LIDPKNSDEIVSAIQKIMNQYERYSLNAKIWSQNFTWDPIGQKYLSLLEEL